MNTTREEQRASRAPLIEELRLAGAVINGDGRSFRCPFHEDRNPSAGIYEKNGVFRVKCHGGGCPFEGGDVFDVRKHRTGQPIGEILPENGRGRSEIVCAYDYVNESGTVVFQVVRKIPKGFFQQRPDGKGGWIPNMKGVQRSLLQVARDPCGRSGQLHSYRRGRKGRRSPRQRRDDCNDESRRRGKVVKGR